ncbi:NADH dehydrogenase [ubiquinone] 1 alpha subcomplex assembly factor 3 [Belonocnema kinseyi]|uniref:NADH dehydrogenase [ubiquinone] 1 alpha subcomplex assembly factor 3 n=1 Tax=Belonocnema kinseyi TaxID=2817044 RepID=UPI00143D214D|nr:NADH dehydrogenase [ubiquinone] 1 alpha subcomplex assembly factor 3 [Belonocnema kinseyi]
MTSLSSKLFRQNTTCIKRYFNRSAIRRTAFETEGKTVVKILNKDLSNGFLINAFSEHGFTLSAGFNVIGPIIVFPRTFLSWNIAASSDMNAESLCLFNVLEPQLDMLIIGLDMQYPAHAPFLCDLRAWLKKTKINAEILPIKHAIPTYNFLAAEGRFVAAALVPPKHFVPEYAVTAPLPKHERIPDY